MTRWLRFLLTMLRSITKPRLRVDQESSLDLRVWPTDADLSLMNHAGYLTVMEQGRVDLMVRTGFLRFLRGDTGLLSLRQSPFSFEGPSGGSSGFDSGRASFAGTSSGSISSTASIGATNSSPLGSPRT